MCVSGYVGTDFLPRCNCYSQHAAILLQWTTDNSAVLSTCASELHNVNGSTCGCGTTGCPSDHGNSSAPLHTILAVMSTGPVGFSDALRQTNASLIRRTCQADGTLLPPAKPLTTIDKLLLAPDGTAPFILSSYDGHVPRGSTLSTQQTAAEKVVRVSVHSWYLLSFGSWNAAQGGGNADVAPFPVSSLDLWPPVAQAVDPTLHSGRAALWQWSGGWANTTGVETVVDGDCSNGSAAAACVTMVQLHHHDRVSDERRSKDVVEASLFHVHAQPPVEQDAPIGVLHILSLECLNGWSLLGDLSKFATHSNKRFSVKGHSTSGFCEAETEQGGPALNMQVHGSAGELVHVTAINNHAGGGAGQVVVKQAKVGPAGQPVSLSFP